jgi:solute carrier family 35 protein F1/2
MLACFVQHYSPFWLYFPAFAVVVLGLVIYFWHATRKLSLFHSASFAHLEMGSKTAEEQGTLDPQKPLYVRKLRGDGEPSGGLPSLEGNMEEVRAENT